MMKNTNNKKYIFIYNSIFNNHENYKNLDNIRDLFQKIKSNKKEREQWNIEINQTNQKKIEELMTIMLKFLKNIIIKLQSSILNESKSICKQKYIKHCSE